MGNTFYMHVNISKPLICGFIHEWENTKKSLIPTLKINL